MSTNTPKQEAVALWQLVETGADTIEGIRAVIDVPEHIERALSRYGAAKRAFEFRAQVRECFERIVTANRVH